MKVEINDKIENIDSPKMEVSSYEDLKRDILRKGPEYGVEDYTSNFKREVCPCKKGISFIK